MVQNGVQSRGTTHDFFSTKGSSDSKVTAQAITGADIEALWEGRFPDLQPSVQVGRG